jgi:hypothetical protein
MDKKPLTVAWVMGTGIIFVLSIAGVLFASDVRHSGSISHFNAPAEPRLLYPIKDEVTLSGKDVLEFRWWNDFMGADHFIFKIYKGYNMYASDLITKQDVPSSASSIKIKSELFEDDQVYTWSLILVALGGQKSDKSFHTFKVIKK